MRIKDRHQHRPQFEALESWVPLSGAAGVMQGAAGVHALAAIRNRQGAGGRSDRDASRRLLRQHNELRRRDLLRSGSRARSPPWARRVTRGGSRRRGPPLTEWPPGQ